MSPAEQNPRSRQGFDHRLAHEGERTMIESTCKECRVSRLVSVLDGTLERWESKHKCQAKGASAPEISAK